MKNCLVIALLSVNVFSVSAVNNSNYSQLARQETRIDMTPFMHLLQTQTTQPQTENNPDSTRKVMQDLDKRPTAERIMQANDTKRFLQLIGVATATTCFVGYMCLATFFTHPSN